MLAEPNMAHRCWVTLRFTQSTQTHKGKVDRPLVLGGVNTLAVPSWHTRPLTLALSHGERGPENERKPKFGRGVRRDTFQAVREIMG